MKYNNLLKQLKVEVKKIYIVQVWFQNQRAKMKKMQKKARLDAKNNNNKDGDCVDEKPDKIKDDDHSKLN